MRLDRTIGARFSTRLKQALIVMALVWPLGIASPARGTVVIGTPYTAQFTITPTVSLSHVQLFSEVDYGTSGRTGEAASDPSISVVPANQSTSYLFQVNSFTLAPQEGSFGLLAVTTDAQGQDHLVTTLNPSATLSDFSTMFPNYNESDVIASLKNGNLRTDFFLFNDATHVPATLSTQTIGGQTYSNFTINGATLYEFSDPNPVGSLDVHVQPTAVPEPASLLMLSLPVAAFGAWSLRRRASQVARA